MAQVIAYRHGGSHTPDDWLSDERREEARAAIAALTRPKQPDAMALLREVATTWRDRQSSELLDRIDAFLTTNGRADNE